MVDDVVRGWASVYPHLRYEEPGEAIAWLSRAGTHGATGWRHHRRQAGEPRRRPGDGGGTLAGLPAVDPGAGARLPRAAGAAMAAPLTHHDRPGQRRGRPPPASKRRRRDHLDDADG